MDANRPQPKPPPGLVARLLTQIRRLLVVAVVIALAALAGKYYWFDRLDEEIRARLELQLREHYPRLAVSVRSARRVAGKGVEIRGVAFAAPGRNQPPLVEIDEIFAECDTRLPDFITQPPQLHSLQINRLKLRAQRSDAGGWNLASLLPLPHCSAAAPPVATINDASLEIIDATQDPPCAWTLRNIQLSISPERETPASDPILQFRGTAAGDYLEKVALSGSLQPKSGAWQLQGEVEGLEFSPRLRAALPRELSHSLAPLASVRGRTHFQFQASRDDARHPAPAAQFVIDGQISEGRIDDERLPEPLTDVVARLHCDNQGIVIDDLSARCGETRVALAARIAGYESTGPAELTLNIQGLLIDRLQVAALPVEVQEVWRHFAPRGVIDLNGRLAFDGQQWIPDFTVRCHDLSLQYDRYPYRVTGGAGTIRVQPDFVCVRLRTIGGGGRTIECRADIRQPGPHFSGWVEVQSEGAIPIDDRLLAALDPDVQRVVRAFHPRGAASFQGRLERDAGSPQFHRKLSVQLHDCSIQHDLFRYPIDKVTGTLELTDDDWLFRNLAGRNDSAYIVGEGSWEQPPGDSPSEQRDHLLSLKFTATDVPLADELRQALNAKTQRLWSGLRPRGNIDHLAVGIKYDGRATSLEIDAQKWPPGQNVEGRSLSIEPAWFRYRLDNLTGTFRYRDGVMQLLNVTANHGRTAISTAGTGSLAADGSVQLDLSRLAADRVEFDQDLAAALPARLGQSLSQLAIEGSLNLLGRLAIAIPADADTTPALDWDLSIDVESGRVATTPPIEHVHGGMRLIGGSGPRGLAMRGDLAVDSAIVRGVQLANIQGPFWTDGRRLVFGTPAEAAAQGRVPRSLTADAFAGQVASDGELSLLPGGTFQVRTVLDDGDLAEIARQLAPRQGGLTGRVFGLANVSGSTAGIHTWRGDGKVRLRDADIYEVPVMLALVKLLSVQRADRTAFTTSELDFRIEGDDLALDRIDFSGDAFSLKGKGRVNMERQVSLKFYPVMGREEQQIPIFRPLLGETGRQFMLIEVTGTLDQPQVNRTVFPKLDDRLRELFPELAREELVEPAMPLLTAPREALDRLRLLPRR